MPNYSPTEQKILALLEKNGKRITTQELAGQIYARRRAPRFAKQAVMTTVMRLGRKLKANKEKIALVRTKRSGPHNVQFWLE